MTSHGSPSSSSSSSGDMSDTHHVSPDSRDSQSSLRKPKQKLDHRPSRQSGKQDKRIHRTRIINNQIWCYDTKSIIFGSQRNDRPNTRVYIRHPATMTSDSSMEFGKDHPSNLVCSMQRSLYCTPIDLQYSYENNAANEYNLQIRLAIWYIPNSTSFQWPHQFTTPYRYTYNNINQVPAPLGPLHRELSSVLLVHLIPSSTSADFRQEEADCSHRVKGQARVHHCDLVNGFETPLHGTDEQRVLQLAVLVRDRIDKKTAALQPILLVMRHNQHLCRLFTQFYSAISLGPIDAPYTRPELAFDQALLLQTGMAQMSHDRQGSPLQGALDWPFLTNRRSSDRLTDLSAQVAKSANLKWSKLTRIYDSVQRPAQQIDPWLHHTKSSANRERFFNQYALFVLQQKAPVPESFNFQVAHSSVVLGESIKAGLTRFDSAAQQLSCILRRWPMLWGEVWTAISRKKSTDKQMLPQFIDASFDNPWLTELSSARIAEALQLNFPSPHDCRGPLSYLNQYWRFLQVEFGRHLSLYSSICQGVTTFDEPVSKLFRSSMAPTIQPQDDCVLETFSETPAPGQVQSNSIQSPEFGSLHEPPPPAYACMSPVTQFQLQPCGHTPEYEECCHRKCSHDCNFIDPTCCLTKQYCAPPVSQTDGDVSMVDGSVDSSHNSSQDHGVPPLDDDMPLDNFQPLASHESDRNSTPTQAKMHPLPATPVPQLKVHIDSVPLKSMTIVQPSSKSPSSSLDSSNSSLHQSGQQAGKEVGDFVVWAGLSCYIEHSRYVITNVEPLTVTVCELWLTETGHFKFGKSIMMPHPSGVMPIGPFKQYETQLFWVPGHISNYDVAGYKAKGILHRSRPPYVPVRVSPASSPAGLQCAKVRKQPSFWPQSMPSKTPKEIVPLFADRLAC